MSQHSTVFAKTERARRKLEIGRIRRELSLASESRRLGSAGGTKYKCYQLLFGKGSRAPPQGPFCGEECKSDYRKWRTSGVDVDELKTKCRDCEQISGLNVHI